MATPIINIEYAVSLGKSSKDNLWQIKYVNSMESSSMQYAYITASKEDPRIGSKIDGVSVVEPGDRLVKVLDWLYARIESYPYQWPWEGTYVNKFGYDFEIEKTNDKIAKVEITEIAYDIVSNKIETKEANKENEIVETKEILEPGGAYVKYTVTLDQPKPMSEIAISPFSPYPLEIVSIMYEEDTETFHPKKELILDEVKGNSDTKSFTFNFSPVTAKRLTIIMRQKNYTKNSYLIREQDSEKKDLWDKISGHELEVTLNLEDNIETVDDSKIKEWTGWNIYLTAQKKFYKELEQWKADKEKYEYYKAKKEEQEKENKIYNESLKEYNEAYDLATEKYRKAKRAYDKRKANDKDAKSEYEKSMKLYNKERADLKEWKKNWG
jgi:hypothetical protein